MISEIKKYFDRNTVISATLTLIILAFYNYKISIIYIVGLIVIIVLKYKFNIIDIKIIKNALINVAVAVIAIFSLTVLGEIWLHLYPHKFTNIDGVDTVGEFSDYTSRGYLTEDIFNKRPGVFRILGLGDSFSVYLYSKGQNYYNYLQKKFDTRGIGDVELVNAGMEAIGPGYYWYILSKYGQLFKPDMVIVGFFVGNDFEEAEFAVNIGNYIMEPKDLIKRYSRYYQFRNWRLYRFSKNKYNRFRDEQLKKQEIKRYPPQYVGTFSLGTFLEVVRTRSWIFDKNKRGELEKNWRKCSDILLKMKDWCDRRQIKLVIVILPDQFQVDQELRGVIFTKYKKIIEKNIDLTQPDTLIENFCRAHNIHCLDLLGQFQEQGKTRQLYALRDTHWNAAGNRLAADLIFDYLEGNRLVPLRPRE
jgi:hypothetical protein